MTRLVDLADRFGSDKGTVRLPAHGYAFFYDMLFERFREQPVNILELGLARTSEDYRGRSELRSENFSPSVSMWLEYFPKARVVGFDLSDFSEFQSERFTFVQGDLGKPEDLRKIAALGNGFDIIVDDGSHASYHQLLALAELFPLLNDGGFFVIEDLIYQPPKIEFEQPASHTAAQLLEAFLDLGYFPETQPIENTAFNAFLGSIHNILLVPYHNKRQNEFQFAVLQKQSGSRYHHYRSKVRFYDTEPSAADTDSLRTQIEIDPENPYPHAHLAHIAVEAGSPAEALESVERALELHDQDYSFYSLKVRILIRLGRVTEAEALAISRVDRGYAVDVFAAELIEVFIAEGQLPAARRLIDHSLAIKGDVSVLYEQAGRIHESENDLAAAEKSYRQAISILPSKLIYYRRLCKIGERQGNLGECARFLQQNEIHFAHDGSFNLLLAKTHAKLGHYAMAEREARKALNDPACQRARSFYRKYRLLKSIMPGFKQAG